MTRHASSATRRSLARRVATNAFFVMAGSLLAGAFILKVYGISVPVLRVARGLIVAISGWKLSTRAATKQQMRKRIQKDGGIYQSGILSMTLPLTTGPGTIAVMISLGLSHAAYSGDGQGFQFVLAALAATVVMAGRSPLLCLLRSDGNYCRARRYEHCRPALAFILFCLGVQIVWTGQVSSSWNAAFDSSANTGFSRHRICIDLAGSPD